MKLLEDQNGNRETVIMKIKVNSIYIQMRSLKSFQFKILLLQKKKKDSTRLCPFDFFILPFVTTRLSFCPPASSS